MKLTILCILVLLVGSLARYADVEEVKMHKFFDKNCVGVTLTQNEIHDKKCLQDGDCYYTGSQSFRTNNITELCSSINLHAVTNARITVLGSNPQGGDFNFMTHLFGKVSKKNAIKRFKEKYNFQPQYVLKGYMELSKCTCTTD